MSEPVIHPELRRVARFLPRNVGRPGVVRASRYLERLMGRRKPPEGGEIARAGDVGVRVHRPTSDPSGPLPALLWIHGGGFVLGHPAQEDALCQHYADELGAVVVAVDYRLAPEHTFPTPLHDCHDALVWLAGRSDVDESRIAIGGASAGGGLTAQLAVLARDRGEVSPAFQLLTYPMLDDRTVLRTDIDERGLRIWNNASNRFGWQSYLGRPPGAYDVPAQAAPARLDDLAGLPPAWVGVGTLDLFHDEDVAYAERLREAGVTCELEVVDGAFHAFDVVVGKADVSQRFRAGQVAALRTGLGLS